MHYEELDRAKVGRLQKELRQVFQKLARQASEREIIAALAEELQYRLTGDCPNQQVPMSQDIEVLMRAVIAVIEGSPHGDYIADKLRAGVFRLVQSLADKMPGFTERIKDQDSPLYFFLLHDQSRS